MPDLFFLRSFSASQELFEQGYLEPLDDLPGLRDNFDPVMLAPWRTKEGIPYGGEPLHVTLGTTVLPDLSPGSSMVRFWVRDNGKGLTPEEQAKLFTPFTRLHHIQAQGHGLGLSIVQRIVEKLDGQVGVESPPLTSQHLEDETDLTTQGSLFWFTLPLVVEDRSIA